LGGLALEARRRPVDRPALLRGHGTIREVHRLPEHVQHASERLGADRHGDRRAEVHGVDAAAQAVGRLHRDRADPVFAEVLFHLRDDLGRLAVDLECDLQRVVDVRQAPGLELDVDDRSDDLYDLADVCRGCSSHKFYCATAPDTTSIISRVIAAWRTLFMYSVRLPIISAEFLVAVSIAVICAAKNAAFDSRSAR